MTAGLVLRTLADYHAFTLTAFCRDCDRSVILDQAALTERYGQDVLFEEIRRRLTCQQCGRRPQRLLVGFRHGGPGTCRGVTVLAFSENPQQLDAIRRSSYTVDRTGRRLASTGRRP